MENYHINALKLQAVYFSLHLICNDRKDIQIKLLIDNTTAVAYIREQGGRHYLQ